MGRNGLKWPSLHLINVQALVLLVVISTTAAFPLTDRNDVEVEDSAAQVKNDDVPNFKSEGEIDSNSVNPTPLETNGNVTSQLNTTINGTSNSHPQSRSLLDDRYSGLDSVFNSLGKPNGYNQTALEDRSRGLKKGKSAGMGDHEAAMGGRAGYKKVGKTVSFSEGRIGYGRKSGKSAGKKGKSALGKKSGKSVKFVDGIIGAVLGAAEGASGSSSGGDSSSTKKMKTTTVVEEDDGVKKPGKKKGKSAMGSETSSSSASETSSSSGKKTTTVEETDDGPAEGSAAAGEASESSSGSSTSETETSSSDTASASAAETSSASETAESSASSQSESSSSSKTETETVSDDSPTTSTTEATDNGDIHITVHWKNQKTSVFTISEMETVKAMKEMSASDENPEPEVLYDLDDPGLDYGADNNDKELRSVVPAEKYKDYHLYESSAEQNKRGIGSGSEEEPDAKMIKVTVYFKTAGAVKFEMAENKKLIKLKAKAGETGDFVPTVLYDRVDTTADLTEASDEKHLKEFVAAERYDNYEVWTYVEEKSDDYIVYKWPQR